MKNLTLALFIGLLISSCSTNSTRSPLGVFFNEQEAKTDQANSIDLKEHFDPGDNKWWNALTLEVESTNLKDSLTNYYPHLYKQIIRDSKTPYLYMLWGESNNFQNKDQIVSEKVLFDLLTIFGGKLNSQYTHAGIIHSYGYLFSTLKTPYGYKRERWIYPTLQVAFELRNNELSPKTSSGTLLSNLSYFIGMFALDNKQELELLKNVSRDLKSFNYDQYKKTVVIEKTNRFSFKTTLIEFPQAIESQTHLLIYTYTDSATGRESLVTAYPINQKAYSQYVKSATGSGVKKKIAPRNNLYLDTTGEDMNGTIEVTN